MQFLLIAMAVVAATAQDVCIPANFMGNTFEGAAFAVMDSYFDISNGYVLLEDKTVNVGSFLLFDYNEGAVYNVFSSGQCYYQYDVSAQISPANFADEAVKIFESDEFGPTVRGYAVYRDNIEFRAIIDDANCQLLFWGIWDNGIPKTAQYNTVITEGEDLDFTPIDNARAQVDGANCILI